jgi:DNA-binding transcriptional LysR family regulator
MENKYIKEFVVLAETCSFQETAEKLFISLSSLSKHISKMEEELGVPLFDRTTRNVQLNKYGIAFNEYAKQIVKLCDDYTGTINQLRMGDNNRLSIGFLAMLGQYGIIEILSDFSKNHPHISLNIVESNEPKELLRSKKCDFAFDAEYGQNDSDIKRLLFKVDNLVAVLPPDHPYAKKKNVTLDQLRDENFIMHHDATSMLSQNLRKFCFEAGFEPKVAMTVSFTSTIVKLVGQGMGIAVLNRMHTPTNNSFKVSLVNIYPSVPFNVYVSHLENHQMPVAASEFLHFIKSRRSS